MLRRTSAFTLIELLIVVAIIGILAAIAVPNYLNAQTRAKVARVVADMKATTQALEMFRLDNNKYIDRKSGNTDIWQLTTPVAYLNEAPPDYFIIKGKFASESPETSWEYTPSDRFEGHAYMLSSIGPDQCCFIGHPDWWDGPSVWKLRGAEFYRNMRYDMSNGLISWGNIIQWGGDDTPLRY